MTYNHWCFDWFGVCVLPILFSTPVLSCTMACHHLLPSSLQKPVPLIPSLGVPSHVASLGSYLKPTATTYKGIGRKSQKIKGRGQGFVYSHICILLWLFWTDGNLNEHKKMFFESKNSDLAKEGLLIMLFRVENNSPHSGGGWESGTDVATILQRWKHITCQVEACMNNIINVK